TVRSKGGVPLYDVTLLVYADATLEDLVGYGSTDENGTATVALETGKTYSVVLSDTPDGYAVEESYPIVGVDTVIELTSSVITDDTSLKGVTYRPGDIMRDFSFTDTAGNTVTLSEILKEKELVVLNFWYIGCSWCAKEFPYLEAAYQAYSDKVEVLGINFVDSEIVSVRDYKEDMGLSFPLMIDTTLATAFDLSAAPVSVMIDRYGMISMVHEGALVGEGYFEKIFGYYTEPDYAQGVFDSLEEIMPAEKPNVEMPSSDDIAATLGTQNLGIAYKPETGESAEYAWPFVIGEKNGTKCILASNSRVTGSYAIMYATVQMKKGDVLALDYFASTERGMDILYILVDGKDIFQISGESEAWSTCYPYVALEDGEYELAFCYMKDESANEGSDTVYLKNLRVETVADIDVPTYIPRFAATDLRDDGFGYETYATVVYSEKDGYYHVGSENGPLLLANLMSASRFSDTSAWLSVYYGLQDGTFDAAFGEKFEAYAMYANNSQIYGYCPVTTELREYLEIVAETFGLEQSENEWLQMCLYYDAYGTSGAQLEDPTKGLWHHSAFEAVMGKENVVTYDRLLVPRGLWYEFIPTKSGVYRIQSNVTSTDISDRLVGWVFLKDQTVYYEFKNEERLYDGSTNVSMVVYMEAGTPYYIDIAYWDTGRVSGSFTFNITYEGAELQHFVMAAPGPATFYESGDGVIDAGHAVTGGIKVKLGDDGYYHHLKEDGTLGSIVYADFSGFTEIFENTSLKTMIEKTDSFNFKISSDDQWVMDFLEIFEKDGVSYEEGFKIEWGDEYDYYMDYFKVEEVVQGKYHGEGTDDTEIMKSYIKKMLSGGKNPELEGCVPVDAKLAEILQKLLDKFWFEDVEDGWIEFCYYYLYLGPTSTAK
ncbi:MAG: TlpA family protein disulfide reductase, partial [Clostridia bacterium]|nr:TlpA family protein disulfide reductase [Clostridia bacterium]